MKQSGRVLGLKIFLAAGAAAILFWRCFCRKSDVEDEEERPPAQPPAAAQPSGHDISLKVVEGPAVEHTVSASFMGDPVSVGRLPHNLLSIADPKVSGDHAAITWSPEHKHWMLVDSGSTNGTKLNGAVISLPDRRASDPWTLQDGDVITIAEEIRLQVSLHPAGVVPVKKRSRSSGSFNKENRGLSVAPRNGYVSLSAAPSSRSAMAQDLREPLLGQPPAQPKAKVVEYHFPGLEMDFAIASQVGSHHWHHDQGSEDVAYWEVPFANFEKTGLFGVCDGHFGPGAARQVQRQLPGALSGLLASDPVNGLLGRKGCREALMAAFKEVDSGMRTEEGATATVLLAERHTDGGVALQVANVGDSGAVLLDIDRHGYRKMTADHRVSAPAETSRLLQKGTPLTHNNSRMYMLNLARAMGDTTFKDMDIGLIAEPFVSQVQYFTSFQKPIVVMASDGLWDAVSEAEVVPNVLRMAAKSRVAMRDLAHSLLKAAIDRGASDDVTVCVMRFWPAASTSGVS